MDVGTVRIRKARDDGQGYGQWMLAEDLRGKTGDAVKAAIDASDSESGGVEVEGRRYIYEPLPSKPLTA